MDRPRRMHDHTDRDLRVPALQTPSDFPTFAGSLNYVYGPHSITDIIKNTSYDKLYVRNVHMIAIIPDLHIFRTFSLIFPIFQTTVKFPDF